jgi:hypothetical protein
LATLSAVSAQAIEGARDAIPYLAAHLRHSANMTMLMKARHDVQEQYQCEDVQPTAEQAVVVAVQLAPPA